MSREVSVLQITTTYLQACYVSFLESSIEKRHDKFMNNFLMMSDYKPVLEAYARGTCLSLE